MHTVTKYAFDTDELEDGSHVQLEKRQHPTGDRHEVLGGLGGGREWYAEQRVLVDDEPVTDWHSSDLLTSDRERWEEMDEDELDNRNVLEELAEKADEPAVTVDELRAAKERSSERYEDLRDEDRDSEVPPWAGSSGLGLRDGPQCWRLG